MKIKKIFLTIWIILITYASITPSENIPNLVSIPHIDKIVHFFMYFGLCILLIPSLLIKKDYLKSFFYSSFLSILAGILFELLQKYITIDRFASIYDFFANTAGTILGALFYNYFIKGKKIEFILFRTL